MAAFSGRLSKAPLVYALCQIRFAPVLKMKELVPDIQDRFREIYEEFDEEQITGIQVQAKSQPIVQAETRWRFESSDKRSGYILQNNSLVFHTTEYGEFDEFVAETVRGFEYVASIARVQRVQRIGLRYVDLIEGDDKMPAENFLHDRLRGFASELQGVTENISQYSYRGATSVGQLILRVTRGRHEIPVPIDLLPLALKVVRNPSSEKISIFLDTDHFTERPDSPISTNEVEKLIRALKAPISATFKSAITDQAVNTWK